MNDQEIENYLQTIELHFAVQNIEDQLQICEENYIRLQQLDWRVHAEIDALEQRQDSLLSEWQTLTSRIKTLER